MERIRAHVGGLTGHQAFLHAGLAGTLSWIKPPRGSAMSAKQEGWGREVGCPKALLSPLVSRVSTSMVRKQWLYLCTGPPGTSGSSRRHHGGVPETR